MTAATKTKRGGHDRAKARARERLAAVGFIASLVSHPVRNRFASLRAVLEILEAGMEQTLSPEHRATVLDEFNVLVEDFNLGLEMVRCDFGRVEESSGRDILAEAVKLFQPAADRGRIAIEITPADGEDRAAVDRSLLRQAILNLMRNAAEALRRTNNPRIVLRTGTGRGRLWIEVADNGPGVPAEFRDRLFREAVTGRPGGTGLGLLLCHDALALMDGSIRHVSAIGEPGARFRLEVPLKSSARTDEAR